MRNCLHFNAKTNLFEYTTTFDPISRVDCILLSLAKRRTLWILVCGAGAEKQHYCCCCIFSIMQIEFLEKSFIPPKVFCARWCCFNIGFGKNVERLLPKIEKVYHFQRKIQKLLQSIKSMQGNVINRSKKKLYRTPQVPFVLPSVFISIRTNVGIIP